jgi:predicted nuclease of restriction endonuclease-like (RecB) superfamily
MTDGSAEPAVPDGYAAWLGEVKRRIHAAQQRATVQVNRELIALYWSIGHDILDRQQRQGWGAGIVAQVSADLRAAFPEMKGFSRTNLMYMRAFAEAWPDPEAFVQQPVGQLPWGHHLVLLTRLKDRAARLAYARGTLTHGWSRAVLVHHIEAQTLERTGQALDNFDRTLPAPLSDLARESLKDPYRFDFLGLGPEASERDVERALTEQISAFLVELGAGFAFVGKQVPIEVDGRDFFLDLLFYHVRLHCYVVVELKAGEFAPEHAGKLTFYLSAVDSLLRTPPDGPTIGLLLCKTRSRVFAEYALRDANKPMGIAEYQLAHALPRELAASLPSIARIEAELAHLGPADEEEVR